MWLLLLSQAFAQNLTWTVPEGAGTDFEVQGYYVQYQIFPNEDCSVNAETPYFVDVKNNLKHSLHKDPNFQPGVQYLVRVASYNTHGISNPSQAQVCVRVRGGKPKMDFFEVEGDTYYNEQSNNLYRGEDYEESESFDFGSVGIPAVYAASSTSDSFVGSRGTAEHRRVLALLRDQRRSRGSKNSDRETGDKITDESELHLKPIKRRVATGDDRMLRNDSGGNGRDSNESGGIGVGAIRSSVQNVQTGPDGSYKPDDRVTSFVGWILLLLGIVLIFRKKFAAL